MYFNLEPKEKRDMLNQLFQQFLEHVTQIAALIMGRGGVQPAVDVRAMVQESKWPSDFLAH